jgi:2-polyprenyl-3-methyl-5-hydroxy-6-metoxy-1,4-benzoquinol methylase
MCNLSGVLFTCKYLRRDWVEGKTVIDVGCAQGNGVRSLLESWGARSCLGVDVRPGYPGVDRVVPADRLTAELGSDKFDIVACTEVLEHVSNWKDVVRNLIDVCRPGGLILITTRSPGYPLHGVPADFWRFTLDDFRAIFGGGGVRSWPSSATRMRPGFSASFASLSSPRVYQFQTFGS